MNNHKREKGTKELVKDIFLEHPGWNATQVYDRYLIMMGDAKKAVGKSSIQKHLEDLKPGLEKVQKSGLDTPWGLGTLKEHPEMFADCVMSGEAIGRIVEAQKEMPTMLAFDSLPINPKYYAIIKGEKVFAVPYRMTIRDARWVSRLYAVKSLKNTSNLCMAAIVYSMLEILSEVSSSPLDTSEADRLIATRGNLGVSMANYWTRLPKGLWLKLLNFIADESGTNLIQLKKESEAK